MLRFDSKTLTSTSLHTDPDGAAEFEKSMKDVRVEKIIINGVGDDWVGKKEAKITVGSGAWDVEITVTKGWNGMANVAVIRDPRAPIAQNWSIQF